MRGQRAITLVTLAVGLAACAGAGSAVPSAFPTIPVQPAQPQGWQVVTSADGDVRLAAPPDLTAFEIPDGILLQAALIGGITPVQVFVTAPRDAQVQPRSGQSLRSWLETSAWVPTEGSGGVTEVAGAAEREIWLPAGRALEVSMTVQPGTPESSRVVAYAIETPDGFGVIQILGHPDFFEDRGTDLELMTRLVTFADGP